LIVDLKHYGWLQHSTSTARVATGEDDRALKVKRRLSLTPCPYLN